MGNETAIEMRDVRKKFRVYYDKGNQLKERLLFRSRSRYEDRWVLNGISFSIPKGQAVGLIGHNGCGKSTTLKLLTRIMYPDSGTVTLNGRVSSLIELGAGFHPDMSGRENIYTNASIFGLKRREIDERMDDIIAFSELAAYLDNPVRTYSSGMYMRLAFSVAINVNADILLIDEILAVGDINFQAKCFQKLREIKAQGTTIVIVSHSLTQIEQICDRTIWLDDGRIRSDGRPRDVHPEYTDYMGQKRQTIAEQEEARRQEKAARNNRGGTDARQAAAGPAFAEVPQGGSADTAQDVISEEVSVQGASAGAVSAEGALGEAVSAKAVSGEEVSEESVSGEAVSTQAISGGVLSDKAASDETAPVKSVSAEPSEKKRWGSGHARIRSVYMTDADGKRQAAFATDSPVRIHLAYTVRQRVEDAVFGIGIFDERGEQVYGTNTRIDQLDRFDLTKDGTMCVQLPTVNLLPGKYLLDVAIEEQVGIPVDYYREAYGFEMYTVRGDVGRVRLAHTWELPDVAPTRAAECEEPAAKSGKPAVGCDIPAAEGNRPDAQSGADGRPAEGAAEVPAMDDMRAAEEADTHKTSLAGKAQEVSPGGGADEGHTD